MVKQGGVSVRVADIRFDDETYSHTFFKEHEIGGTSYIKVATGDQFIVIIDISPDFDFMGAPEVQICCRIDEDHAMWALSAADIARLRDQHNMRRINFFDTERFIDDRWMRCALSFGELEISNRNNWSPQRIRELSFDLGRIVVTITRGATQPWGPVMVEPEEAAYDHECTARAVVENHHITHALKALPFEECFQPWQDWHFEPAHGRAGRPMELEICYRSQETLELLGIAPNTGSDVKDEPEDRKDPAIKTERVPVMPKLEIEAVVKIEDAELDLQRPPVKSEAPSSRRKKLSSRPVKQEQEQDVTVAGNKRKRADIKPTSTSKKVKRERLSVDPELEQDGPSSRTRSKTRTRAKISSEIDVSKASAEASEVFAGQQGDDNDDDEVVFISSRPVRRVVGRFVID